MSKTIKSMVGTPINVIPNDIYGSAFAGPSPINPDSIASGAVADCRGYSGAVMICNMAALALTGNQAGIIPYHGPCPEWSTHVPVASTDWGFFFDGGTGVPFMARTFMFDFTKVMPFLSAELTFGTASAVCDVTVVPIGPAQAPNVPSFDDPTVWLSAIGPGDQTFPDLNPM